MRARIDARSLFLAVLAGITLYVLLDIVAQLLPPHYSPIRDAESDLAVGPYGYVMALNFVNRGVLSIVFVYALLKVAKAQDGAGAPKPAASMKLGAALLMVWAVGSIVLAAFPTDVPATPVSWHGAIHGIVAILVFFGGAFGTVALSLRFEKFPELKGVKRVSLAISILAVVFLLITLGSITSSIVGLTERIFLGSVLLWIAVVSAHLMAKGSAESPSNHPL